MTMKEAILGISAYYHDSAAAQEERFPRTKHNSRFPIHACQYVLEEAGLDYNDLQAVAFYDKPLVKFERSPRDVPCRRAERRLELCDGHSRVDQRKLFMKHLLAEQRDPR